MTTAITFETNRNEINSSSSSLPSSRDDGSSEISSQSVFKLYSDKTWRRLLEMERLEKDRNRMKSLLESEGKLVDGQIQFDDQVEAVKEKMKCDPDLVEGNILFKSKFGEIPSELIGKPIEEIDRYVKDKTFVVINSRFKKHVIYRFSATKSFFIFGPLNPLRKLCMIIITNFLFDWFIMATILVNCGFMTLTQQYDAAEYTLLAIYTTEMLLKFVSRGFLIERHTYLRDPWNWLDLMVVLLSYALMAVDSISGNDSPNVGVLRTFRVFRVLKTISLFPGLKTIIGALLQSMKMLFEVILLTLLCLSVFAIFEVQMYKGVLRNKCVRSVDWSFMDWTNTNKSLIDNYYNFFIKQNENWMMTDENGVYWLCGNGTGAGRCENSPYAKNESWVCLPNIGENPNWGYTNFDNFGMALLSSFQLLTLDFWEDLYSKIIRTSGSWNVIYFILVVFLGSLYLINLMLAVVTMRYEEEAAKFVKQNDLEDKENRKIKQKINGEHNADPALLKMKNAITQNTQRKESFGENQKVIENCRNIEDIYTRKVKVEDLKVITDTNFRKHSLEDQESSSQTNSKPVDENITNCSPVMVISEGEILIDRNCHCCANCCLCYIPWLKIQISLYAFVTDPLFDIFITFCIFVNTVVMATEHYPMSKTMSAIQNTSNDIFTAIFTLEAILKITSMSKEYFNSGWNIFDFLIVIASLIDIAVDEIDSLSIFRAFRLLRVFKLSQSWRTMRVLLTIIFSALSAVGNLTLILIIVIFVFAVTGLQLFKGSYTEEVFGGSIPRWNFESFPNSLMMVFRIICGEWIEALWDCMRAKGTICMIVFIPTLVLGNFMVLNLFLALLLNTFASDSLKEDNYEDDAKIKQALVRLRSLVRLKNRVKEKNNLMEKNPIDIQDSKNDSDDSLTVKTTNKPYVGRDDDKKLDTFNQDNKKTQLMLQDCCCLPCYRLFAAERCFGGCLCCTCPVEKNYGAKWQQFRYTMLLVTEHKAFEYLVLIMILASSVTLAFEDIYLNNNLLLKSIVNYTNILFALLFTIEMFMKIISLGVKSYFTSFWTILDFCIVCVSWSDLIASLISPETSQIAAFRSLRILRGFRPLRTVSRWQNMKIVVNALLYAIPSIFNVLVVCMVFWLIFSIIGVQFFKGKFFHCEDNYFKDLSHLITPNKSECLRLGFNWRNRKINFDNVAQGLLALYQVATFEGWMEIMRDATDVTNIDLQPIRENSKGYYIYFVIFIIVGSFFILNLFIGVIIDNFNSLKKKYEGNYFVMFLTVDQQHYYNTLKKLSVKKPHKIIQRPKNEFQNFFYDVSVSSKFDMAITLFIFLNMIAMMVDHYEQPESITQVLEIINIIFITIFTLEAIVKIIGLRWHYLRQAWNVFDFIIVILSIIGLVINNLMENVFITPNLLRVIRIFRINRVLRLIRAAKGIRKFIFALVVSLPALFNIGALLFLVVFIYAIIGMSMFGNVKKAGGLNDLVNFENFERSMLLLFRLTTCAGWNDILYPLLISAPDCNSTHVTRSNGVIEKVNNGDCSFDWLAILYMASFVLFVNLIVINMYVAVILENFTDAHEQEEVGITEDDFDNFYMIWEQYDPHASQYIKFEQLSNFVAQLDEPLGIPKPNVIALVSFDLPIVEGDKLHCLDILLSLVRHVLGDVEESEEFLQVKKHMEEKYQKTFPVRNRTQLISTTMRRKKEEIAAKILQRAWRYHKIQRAFRQVTENAMILAGKSLKKVPTGPSEQTISSTLSLKNFSLQLWEKIQILKSTAIVPATSLKDLYHV